MTAAQSRPDLVLKWISRAQTATDGIPMWIILPMDVGWTERLLGEAPGSYWRDPVGFALGQYQAMGTAFLDQLVTIQPDIGVRGWESRPQAGPPVLDGITIDGPEAVKRHYEQALIPQLEQRIASFPEQADSLRREWVESQRRLQEQLGPEILKVPYEGCQEKPLFRYSMYGYVEWFSFYALYPELAEEAFRLEGDYAALHNALMAQAILNEGLPQLVRSDHDMTSAQGSLVDIRSLDQRYFPHLERAMRPLIERGVKLIWHCDGNVNDFVPRLLDMGYSGFQGFQYECGMDYPAIAKMRTREGDPLVLIVGASVTTTMVFGGPQDVHREVDWLVENSDEASISLGATSSICPGTPWENIDALVEALQYYQEHGKAGLRQQVGRERPFASR